MVQHQVSDTVLLDYAAGNLHEAFGLVVATQVSICDAVRGRLDEMEQIGGAVLEESGCARLAEGSYDAVLARIRSTAPEPEPGSGFGPERTADCPVLPGPVRTYVGGGVAAIRWRSLGMGVRQAVLHSSKTASARLLYIPAGAHMPDHGHHGTEMTLVLQGAFLDGDRRYARGDVAVADEDVAHTPVADIGEDCICLAACEGALKFTGLLPRIVQPFFRI